MKTSNRPPNSVNRCDGIAEEYEDGQYSRKYYLLVTDC